LPRAKGLDGDDSPPRKIDMGLSSLNTGFLLSPGHKAPVLGAAMRSCTNPDLNRSGPANLWATASAPEGCWPNL